MGVNALFNLFGEDFDSIFVVVEKISECIFSNFPCGSIFKYFGMDEIALHVFTELLEIASHPLMAIL